MTIYFDAIIGITNWVGLAITAREGVPVLLPRCADKALFYSDLRQLQQGDSEASLYITEYHSVFGLLIYLKQNAILLRIEAGCP